MIENNNRKFLGKTTATQNVPSTVSEYYFWVSDDAVVQPYDFVTSVDNDFYSVGVVLEISTYTDALSHLANRLTSDLPPSANLSRLNAKVARAAVFYSFVKPQGGEPRERLQPTNSGADVFVSTEEEILMGLNAGRQIERPIPGGLIVRSEGDPVVVSFDEDYLFGPQSAHMNISGISGLGTKTSYMMFLLYIVDRLRPNQYINIIFNVKQADLMNLNVPAETVSEEDKRLYKKMLGEEFEPQPFDNVIYYAPLGKDGRANTYSQRNDLKLYAFALSDCYSDLDLLFADVPDEYGTVDSFARYARRDWDRRNSRWEMVGSYQRYGKTIRVNYHAGTWSELENLLREHADDISAFYGLAQTTIARIQRNLGRLTSSGMFVNMRSQQQEFIRNVIANAQAGQKIVIDIAKLNLSEQGFVVGEVFRELEDIINSESEGNERRAIVVVDELNTLAPKDRKSELKHQIIEVSRKGRSAHFTIFGAEQFASEVDDQIIGNSALRVVGRTSSIELQGPAFKFLSQPERNSATILRKGELLISFPTFRANIKIKFPKPLYKTPD
ncbi:MAG: ATP-binding protein [Candidatus Parvarchaeota archaeon]